MAAGPGGAAGLHGRLGVRRVLNAAGTFTWLGGSLMPSSVLDAMREAAGCYVDVHELHAAAGRRLAELTGNEAADVTAGCAAGIVLAVLACATGGDPDAIARMPGGDGLRTEVVLHAAHRIPADRAVDLAGGRIVEVGAPGGTRPGDLEAAIGPRTAMVLYVAGSHVRRGALDLASTVAIAHARGVPVVVDAAAQLPPAANLWRYTRELGADLALFSGGKGLRGPQASGLMVGRAALVAAARANGAPHDRLARALKVGKEEIAGLVRAVEVYLARDHAADLDAWEAVVRGWLRDLDGIPGVDAARDPHNQAGQPVPRVRVAVDPAVAGRTAAAVRAALWGGDPRVAVHGDGGQVLHLTPDTLEPGEAEVVGARLRAVLAGDGSGDRVCGDARGG